MHSRDIAKILEKVFFPPNSVIFGLAILILYSISSTLILNDIAALFLSSAVYFAVVYAGRHSIKSTDALYFLATLMAILSFLFLSTAFLVSKQFYFAAVSLFFVASIIYFIRYRWKISAHMASFASVFTVLFLINYYFAFLIFALPLIGWSRLKLREHTPAQIVAGTLIAILLPYLIYFAMF